MATRDRFGAWRHARLGALHPLRGWVLAIAVGAVVAALLPSNLGWTVRTVAAWDAGLLVRLGLPWRIMLRSDPARTRQRAAAEDPGAVGVLLIALIASAVSLVATVVLFRGKLDYVPDEWARLLVGLGVGAVVGAWALMHTAFALHYARLYYDDSDQAGGLEFAGGPPDDLDFAYFAFTLGMTYQTADVTISGRAMRRFVLLHAVLSFAFNTVILALAVSLIFGHLG